jgi:hypothetical protein
MSRSSGTSPLDRGELPVLASLPPLGDVLALVTGTAPWSGAALVGASLAARWGSALTGCFIDPALRMLGAAEAEPTVLSLLQERTTPPAQDMATADFAAFAHRLGVPEASWVVAQAGVAQVLRKLGAWHDLAVLERDMIEPEGLFEVLGEALLACRMPCLILPPGTGAAPGFERIAIGWNGSLEAVRAIHAALPLLAAADEVRIFDGAGARDDENGEDGLPFFEPYGYLARHGIAVRLHTIHADAQAAGSALLEEARRMRADLLVMGAYGHSRLRERVLGGATRYVLAHAEIPVLMQH